MKNSTTILQHVPLVCMSIVGLLKTFSARFPNSHSTAAFNCPLRIFFKQFCCCFPFSKAAVLEGTAWQVFLSCFAKYATSIPVFIDIFKSGAGIEFQAIFLELFHSRNLLALASINFLLLGLTGSAILEEFTNNHLAI